MMSSHSSFHTLSRNIRPYMHKADERPVTNPPYVPIAGNSALKELNVQLRDKTESVEKLIGFLEDVTWLKIPDDQTRNEVVDLIQIAKLYCKEEQAYATSLHRGTTNNNLEQFLLALDDLKETIHDVESAIITLPKLDGYNEIFDELSRL